MRMVLGLGSIVVKYAMFEREGHEVFEKRAEKRDDPRGKGEGCSRWRHRDDTKKRNLNIFCTPDTFRFIQYASQPIIQAPNTPV